MATIAIEETGARAPAEEAGFRLSAAQFWGVLMIAPYVLIFLVFVLYPVLYGFWLAREPNSYSELFADPIFLRSVLVGPMAAMLLYLLFRAFINSRTVEGLPQFLKAVAADLTPYLSGDAVRDYPNLANLPTSTWTGRRWPRGAVRRT